MLSTVPSVLCFSCQKLTRGQLQTGKPAFLQNSNLTAEQLTNDGLHWALENSFGPTNQYLCCEKTNKSPGTELLTLKTPLTPMSFLE